MRKLRWNWPVWLGFALSVVAFVSYFRFFARFPVTRNVPSANFLLFGAGATSLWAGLKRVRGRAKPFRGKIVSSILTLLSVSIFAVFSFVIFHVTRRLPAAAGLPKIGEKAPEFVLRDTHGNLTSLSTTLSAPLDPSNPTCPWRIDTVVIFHVM